MFDPTITACLRDTANQRNSEASVLASQILSVSLTISNGIDGWTIAHATDFASSLTHSCIFLYDYGAT